ncbi:MAG: hypothetical protein ACRDMZ_22450, partial [Solirubrobacteraceae bacterium]
MIDLGGDAAAEASGARGSGFTDVRRQLDAAIVAAGFLPVTGDGIEDALSGRDVDRDAAPLAAAIGDAQRAFGELRCSDATATARHAIGLAAARQAGGRPVPELARAWSLVLLCADRDNQLDVAMSAATQLRALGGSPDVPAAVWAKYPEIDAIADRELVEVTIETEVPGAAIWIDFRMAGTSPLKIELAAGDHVLAAALGNRRGWAAGTAVRTQKTVRIPLSEAGGTYSDLARKVAGWKGKMPELPELGWVLARARVRIALVRRGNTVEAWGRIGMSEPPHLLGGEDGNGPINDADRVLAVVADRVRTWNSHAPDPDRPLLVEERRGDGDRGGRKDEPEKPAKWWVYAAIAGAAAIGGVIIYAHDSASDRQRVELH